MIRLFPEQALGLRNLIRNRYAEGEITAEIAEALRVIEEQLNSPYHATELVDTVARLLSENKSHVFNGRMLLLLRKAILSPSELAKVAALEGKHVCCAICARDLNEGETLTLMGTSLACYKCCPPQVVTCAGCNHPLEVPGVSRVITKAVKSCEHCKAGDKKKDELEIRPRDYDWHEDEPEMTRPMAARPLTATRLDQLDPRPATRAQGPANIEALQRAMTIADERRVAQQNNRIVIPGGNTVVTATPAQPGNWITIEQGTTPNTNFNVTFTDGTEDL